ncbi:type I-C CRISPR-associated endonuclease Cas1 [Limisphaera ngatamarikiensis]|uniref:CRISPR-associated endonuclease Cas1 n=1 Tax=Limisphaera ngatamarikiensis TaxID=1324935 RepID=A0A6M1RK00_9BACT|nr:type I-C CRISPR-associated endonuclease Cas1c [Limisphaera ngatamarikiensis]NGO37973.1 type I-C CRISPR-associated endonuclease Cas1 [Limisphaera ngatamarikiensis]
MPDIAQNTLYLTTPGTYVARDHLTLLVKVPLCSDGSRSPAGGVKCEDPSFKCVRVPIHHLESICVFGPSTISPPALHLCWEHGVAVNFLSEFGLLQARLVGVADTSVTLRRAQFRAADDPPRCAAIARQIIAAKLQNSRNSLLRGAREAESPDLKSQITPATDALGRQIEGLGQWSLDQLRAADALDALRGIEGLGSATYFGVFTLLLKQQREVFRFTGRIRRPPRDRINCLLSFLYALLRHDCIAALTCAGLDPFVGFLHAERPNRPALALDLMEEFRPWLADRLAITLINRQQIGPEDFRVREGGAVELSDAGRKQVIQAYQERKQVRLTHPLLEQEFRIGQLPFIQARILARHLRGDLPEYVPFIPK